MKKIFLFSIFCFLFSVFTKASPPDTLRYFDGSFKSLKRESVRLKQPYALLFGASWCAPCHALQRDVLNSDVIASFANSHFLIKYVDLESFEGLEVNNEFKINQLPTMLFFDPSGKKIDDIVGLVEINQMYKRMRINSGFPISRVYETFSNDTITEE